MRREKINPNLITGFLMLGYTILYMDKAVIGTALIPIAASYSLTSTQTGMIVSAFFLGYSIMQIPLGYLADRVGYKRVLLYTLCSCVVFTLLFGLAGAFPAFLVIRFLMGTGDAGYPPSSAKSVALNYPVEKRPFAQSLLLSTGGIGGILAAVVGVNVISAHGWKSAYWLMSGLFALALLGVLVFLPGGKAAVPEAGPEEKVRFRDVIRCRSVWVLFFAMMCYNIVIYSLTTWMPTFVVKTFRLQLKQVSPLLAAAALLGVCGSLLAGKLYGKRIGHEKPMLLLTAVLLAAILAVASAVRQYAAVCVLLSVSVFVCEFLFVGLFTWPHKLLDKKIIGSAIGVINTGGTLGGFIGPTLFGAVLDASAGSFVPAFLGMGAFALAAGLLAQLVTGKKAE